MTFLLATFQSGAWLLNETANRMGVGRHVQQVFRIVRTDLFQAIQSDRSNYVLERPHSNCHDYKVHYSTQECRTQGGGGSGVQSPTKYKQFFIVEIIIVRVCCTRKCVLSTSDCTKMPFIGSLFSPRTARRVI